MLCWEIRRCAGSTLLVSVSVSGEMDIHFNFRMRTVTKIVGGQSSPPEGGDSRDVAVVVPSLGGFSQLV